MYVLSLTIRAFDQYESDKTTIIAVFDNLKTLREYQTKYPVSGMYEYYLINKVELNPIKQQKQN